MGAPSINKPEDSSTVKAEAAKPAAKAAEAVAAPEPKSSAIVGDRTIVFRVGRSIRTVAVHGKRVRTVAKAAGIPIGLSIAGNRIAWAENVAGRGRIRAVTLAP